MKEQTLLFFFALFTLCLVLIIGLAFVISPEGVASKARQLGAYVPILDLARTKSGRVQLRIMGLIFVIAAMAMATVFVSRFDGK